MLCALIMAGGKGERFWPLSTEEKPKQFLKLLGEETMIQMTVKRLAGLIPIHRIFVVTAKNYVGLVQEQLPALPKRNIIVEPVGKNTAPCIALSALLIDKYYKNAALAVLPSDHLIVDEDKFRDILNTGYEFVEAQEKAIVTLGMKPDRPETGYGYIKSIEENTQLNSFTIKKVAQFVEKPNLEKAKAYVSDGSFLWNGGMFIWKVKNILALTKEHLSATYKLLMEIVSAPMDAYETVLETTYPQVESISIDYGIMEKAKDIYVIPSDFGWDDVGNWTSIERYKSKDENKNIKNENSYYYKSEGNIVLTRKKVLLNNVKDLIVVEAEDYIMISSKQKEQDIKIAKTMLRGEDTYEGSISS